MKNGPFERTFIYLFQINFIGYRAIQPTKVNIVTVNQPIFPKKKKERKKYDYKKYPRKKNINAIFSDIEAVPNAEKQDETDTVDNIEQTNEMTKHSSNPLIIPESVSMSTKNDENQQVSEDNMNALLSEGDSNKNEEIETFTAKTILAIQNQEMNLTFKEERMEQSNSSDDLDEFFQETNASTSFADLDIKTESNVVNLSHKSQPNNCHLNIDEPNAADSLNSSKETIFDKIMNKIFPKVL